jgi:putative ABC transport system permease protein
MTVPLPERLYATVAQKRDFYVRLLERIESLPGAEDASAVNLLPFGFASWKGDFAVEGRAYQPTDLVVGKPAVSESYFRIMGIPLLRGRAFEARDRDGAPLVTVVSESVARFCWGDEDPLGKRLTMDDPKAGRWLTVVGIVGDIRQDNLAAERLPMIYVPLRQESHAFFLWAMAFVVRPRGEPAAIADALRDQVRELDPELPVQRIEFLDRLLSESLAEPRFRTGLLLTFALLALLLALVGIYGVIAYEVARRTCEIGIRRALGAQTSDVLRLVVGRTAALVSIGLVGGLLGAVAITRVLASFLFGVQPIDVGTFFVVSLGLAAVAILASVVPARRAARVDPAVALRYE